MQDDEKLMKVESAGRREFLRRSAYVAPAILTFQATSAFAKAGSNNVDDDDDRDRDGRRDRGRHRGRDGRRGPG